MNAMLQPDARPVGIFRDVPADVYQVRALDVANAGGLNLLDERSPAHFHHWVHDTETSEDESAALTFGRAFHCATLEPEVFAATYTILPANAPRDLRRFRNAKKPSAETLDSCAWWDEWDATHAGRFILPAASLDRATAMARSLRAMTLEFGDVTITVADLIDECETEVTLYWIDEDTGIYCKARADLWSEDLALCADLKSCLDAGREAFSRAVFHHRYHVQATHYGDGFRTLGKPLRSFVFLPAEKAPPHVPAAWHLDAPAEERGWALRQRAMRTLRTCLDTGRWPGYTRTVESLALPAFAFYDSKD